MNKEETQSPANEHKPIETSSPAMPGKDWKKNKLPIIIVIAFIAVVVALGAGYAMFFNSSKQATTASKQPVIIGLMFPFSGGTSEVGAGVLRGVQLAQKDLPGSNIELIQGDSKCDPQTAATVIKELIAKKVVAILGAGCSAESVAALPEANRQKIFMLSPVSTSPALSIPNDYFFRDVAPDTFQGKFGANMVFEKGLKKASLLYTPDPYGAGLAKVFKDKFQQLGGTIVSEITYEKQAINLQQQARQVKASNPDVIYISSGSFLSAGVLMKLIRQAGVTAPFYSSDGVYDQSVIDNAQGAAEGLIISTLPTGTKAFKQEFEAEYGKTGSSYGAPQAYDAYKAFSLAIKQGAATGDDFKRIMPSIEFEGVSAHVKFDQNGEISDNYIYDVLQVKNGKFVPIEK